MIIKELPNWETPFGGIPPPVTAPSFQMEALAPIRNRLPLNTRIGEICPRIFSSSFFQLYTMQQEREQTEAKTDPVLRSVPKYDRGQNVDYKVFLTLCALTNRK
jgi:hypothetical protein